MRTRLLLVLLLSATTVLLLQSAPGRTQRPQEEATLTQRIAKSSQISEESVTRVLNALGPALQEELKKGRQVNLPRLGTFRVIRVAEHLDLAAGGRPVTVPAYNSIEFLPEGTLVNSANAPGAKPAETIPPFQYNTLPGQTPGQKTGRTRVPPDRIK